MSDPKMTMEVPPQVRDFAIKSINQAERAISSFMESASDSVAVVPSPMNDAAQRALAITEKNLKAAFEPKANFIWRCSILYRQHQDNSLPFN
jgi:hypothetical protein